MPRPRKCRRVCDFPRICVFEPVGSDRREEVALTVDEYETIRLIDRQGLSQEQCAGQMGVSRTTIQLIYASARKKLADALVEGLTLRIGGGEYELCGGETKYCGRRRCFKRDVYEQYTKPEGEMIMRIAVTFEDGQVFQHFGHTEQFKIYDVEDGKVVSSQVAGTDGQGHGALAGVLKALGADVLICGGIGGGARAALDVGGIKLYGGVSGSADEAVEAFIAGRLSYDPEARCDHHGHHGEGHGCGHHDGGHPCGRHGGHGGQGSCGHHGEQGRGLPVG